MARPKRQASYFSADHGARTGLEPATSSRATIRCRPLQSVLVRPDIRLFNGFSLISGNRLVCYVLACTSTVAVNNTLLHGDPEPVPCTHRLIVRGACPSPPPTLRRGM
jgi:hypothetical protein